MVDLESLIHARVWCQFWHTADLFRGYERIGMTLVE